jgi:ribosome biogenesis GTPase
LVVAATVSAAVPGVEVVVCSVVEAQGLSELTDTLGPGITGALLGPSGVGKSSLVNWLTDTQQLATGAVRVGDGKGRHTTTRRQMIGLASGGWLIDTPGIRELGLWLDAEAVDTAFPEIEALAAGCRFRDCRHETEPGCAVRAAVEDGTLDPGRWEGYLRLRAEAEAHERRSSPHEQRAHERRFAKMVRAVTAQKRDRHR